MGFFIIDAAVLDLAQRLLHIVLWSSVPVRHGDRVLGRDARQRNGVDAAIDLDLCGCRDRGSLAVLLSRAIGIDGVWAAYPITFGAMFLLQMSYYLLVWRKRAMRRLI